MELKRVVVTGLGAVTPLGNNAEDTLSPELAALHLSHYSTRHSSRHSSLARLKALRLTIISTVRRHARWTATHSWL